MAPRRPRRSAEVIMDDMLGKLTEFTQAHGAPLDLHLPTIDDVLGSFDNATRPPRSSLYRIWPGKEDMVDDFLLFLFKNDPYNTVGLADAFSHVKTEATAKKPQREQVLIEMGSIVLTATDHSVVANLERATKSRTPERVDFVETVRDAQAGYISTLKDGYASIHGQLGDELREGSTYEGYARELATVARAVVLNDFSAYDSGDIGPLLSLADKYTIPVNQHGKDTLNTSNIVEFFARVGRLKEIPRTGWTRYPIPRPESIADHSFRVSVMAMFLAPKFGVDPVRATLMLLLHDLGEYLKGDIVTEDAHGDLPNKEQKLADERQDLLDILGLIDAQERIELQDEFVKNKTPLARFANQLDKLEMAIQAREYEIAYGVDLGEFYSSASREIDNPDMQAILQEAINYKR
jgi:putative hydrolases of HD superfamily